MVKATAPVLKTHGVALTRHFYARMFEHNPELKHIFNQGHQAGGEQQQALAGAVAAYAEQIDDPSVLAPVVTRIVHKHVSLGVRPEHYPIVGKHLLASIREVLGEAATDELVDASAAAYGQLADLLIAEEARLYADSAAKPGGWTGWRAFRVARREAESSEITSFYLEPADGGQVPGYQPGQYVSVRLYVPELGLMQPRQYSLSDAPGQGRLRISVKREPGVAGAPAGRVSNALHDRLQVGGVLDVAPPQGDFQLREAGGAPVVLLSGGVGLTPMVSMLNHLVRADDGRQIRFVHGCRNRDAHAMRDHVNTIAAGRAMCARRSSMRKWAAGTSRAATTTTPAASTCAPSATPPSCRARTTTCAAPRVSCAPSARRCWRWAWAPTAFTPKPSAAAARRPERGVSWRSGLRRAAVLFLPAAMQLNRFTDFGLRVLMYLTQCRDRPTAVTIPEIADRFGASRNHLVKVAHFMAQRGWVVTTRGRGGLCLAHSPAAYRLGDLVRELEEQGPLIDCREPPCALDGACRLSGVLAQAMQAFFDRLNAHTLADLVRDPTGAAIIRLHRAA